MYLTFKILFKSVQKKKSFPFVLNSLGMTVKMLTRTYPHKPLL